MSDLFSIYEDSFNVLLHRVSKVTESMGNLSKEKTEQAINEANLNLTEAESHLKRMELECDSGFGKNIDRLKLKVKNYKNEYGKVKDNLYKLQEQYINRKSNEIRLGNLNTNLIEDEEESYKNSEKLEKGKRAMLYVENNAKQSIQGLSDNSDKMRKINARTVEVESTIDDSDNLMTNMIRKSNKNKYLIIGLGIFFILLLIIVIVYNVQQSGTSEIKENNNKETKENIQN